MTEEEERVVNLKIDAGNAIYRYWEALPEPKRSWHDFYYGDGGFWDLLEDWHVLEKGKGE